MNQVPLTPEDITKEGDRNYDLGRHHAQEEIGVELFTLRATYGELYQLVESYLTTPNTDPVIVKHYDKLCEWFVSHQRPDGSPPLPIAPTSKEFGNTEL